MVPEDSGSISRRLNNQVAIVTGAAGGIGTAVAERLAAEGASVVCTDNRHDVVEVAERIRSNGGTAASLVADLSQPTTNYELVSHAMQQYGRLDILHANAAVQIMGGVGETRHDDWQRLFEVNLRAVADGVAAALPVFSDQGGGSVIITASVLGMVGDPDMPAYGAMKGALRSMCRSLAAAHGHLNVRVNTICPGDVDTPMLQDFFERQPDGARARARVESCYPLGRMARPEDVAAVVAFLASGDSAYITGTDIIVDGGLLAKVY